MNRYFCKLFIMLIIAGNLLLSNCFGMDKSHIVSIEQVIELEMDIITKEAIEYFKEHEYDGVCDFYLGKVCLFIEQNDLGMRWENRLKDKIPLFLEGIEIVDRVILDLYCQYIGKEIISALQGNWPTPLVLFSEDSF